jgi:hypothetical protein
MDYTTTGERLAAEGPQALFDQLEDFLPDGWRDQIVTFPLAAIAVGFGVGLFLGLKKGDEVIAAASSMAAAAATANLASVLGQDQPQD